MDVPNRDRSCGGRDHCVFERSESLAAVAAEIAPRHPAAGTNHALRLRELRPQTGLLFIAHLGDSRVLVFDTNTQKLVAEIAGVSDVHGVLAVPSLGRAYGSATGTGEVVAINERNLRVVARIP